MRLAGATIRVTFDVKDENTIMGGLFFEDTPKDADWGVWVWVEDARNRWVVDYPRPRGCGKGSSIGGDIAPFKSPPAMVVAARIVGVDRVKLPFTLKGIPIPPPETRK